MIEAEIGGCRLAFSRVGVPPAGGSDSVSVV